MVVPSAAAAVARGVVLRRIECFQGLRTIEQIGPHPIGVFLPNIPAPFFDISMHVVQAEGIGLLVALPWLTRPPDLMGCISRVAEIPAGPR